MVSEWPQKLKSIAQKWGKPRLKFVGAYMGMLLVFTTHRGRVTEATSHANAALVRCSGGYTDARPAWASATVMAVMLTMRRTVAEGVSTCTGRSAPSSTGPMAMPPPAATFSRL